jgi:MarR family transcriptional regulator for hemolysin
MLVMDPYVVLFDLIGMLGRRRYQAAEKSFAALGLNHTEARLLTLLQEAGGSASQEALSEAVYVDRTNVGRALKRLEAGGMITRKQDEADKRGKRVHITGAGSNKMADITALKTAMARDFFPGMDARDIKLVIERLKKMLDSAEFERHLSPGARPGGAER